MTQYIVAQNEYSLQDEFYWIDQYHPRCGCNENYHKNHDCDNQFCTKHGQANRIDIKKEIEPVHLDQGHLFTTVLKFNYLVTPGVATKARTKLIKALKYKYPEIQFIWRYHFVNYVPHINIMSVVNSRSAKNFIITAWEKCLKSMDHPHPKSSKSYQDYTLTEGGWLNYMFQCNRQLPSSECPPAIKGMTWSYWGISDNWGKIPDKFDQ